VARQVAALCGRRGIGGVDPFRVADAWRARYRPQMDRVRRGERPWVDLDVLNRESLDEVLAGTPLDVVPGPERDVLALAWHRLDPWPDVVPGLTVLRRRHTIAPCSNGHVALLRTMAVHAGLPWDLLLGAETAHAYKPDPSVYLACAEAAGAAPGEVMLVAAHGGDLEAAAACGLRTAFVPRPREHGPGGPADPGFAGAEVVATDLIDLARALDG
jgi:2-haloacid dehalogenase